MTHTDDDLKRIMRRLKKVLALTQSAEPGEAAAALQQAKSIMDKYGIDAADADASAVEEVDVKLSGADMPYWENRLVAVVVGALGVEVLIRRYEKVKGRTRPRAHVIFVGEGPKAQIAAYTFDVLRRQLANSLRKSFAELVAKVRPGEDPSQFKISTQQRDAYAAAWCLAVHDKIRHMVAQPSEIVRQYLAKKAVAKSEPKKTSTKRLKEPDAVSQYLLVKGAQDGRAVQLNQGMGSTAQPVALAYAR